VYICVKNTNNNNFNYSVGEAFKIYKWGIMDKDDSVHIENLQTEKSDTTSFSHIKKYLRFFKLATGPFSVPDQTRHGDGGRIYYNKNGEVHREDGPAKRNIYYLKGDKVEKAAITSIMKSSAFDDLSMEYLEEILQDISDTVDGPNLRFSDNYYKFTFNSIHNKVDFYSELAILVRKMENLGFDVDIRLPNSNVYGKLEIFPL